MADEVQRSDGARRRRGSDARALVQARTTLRARLEARRAEIEQATLTRVFAISDPTDTDPVYREGLRASVSVALDYALEAVERGEERAPPPPPVLLVQARMAARIGIGLDTVLRRYLAGYSLLSEFLVAEAEDCGLMGRDSLKRLLHGQASTFDRLLAVVAEEHCRESANRCSSTEEHRLERVERLLAGEPLDTTQLDYEFEAHHTGLIAAGPQVAQPIRELATAVDCRLLLVNRDETTAWAWLGSRRGVDPVELESALASVDHPRITLAIGEPAAGLAGWRLTHRQAAAALPIAVRRGEPLVRYAGVALLASALQDDLLARSLRDLYLLPLSGKRDGGPDLRGTLRAYFETGRNVSSAAATLNVSRQTIRNRIQAIEERLGCTLDNCGLELEFALQLDIADAISIQCA